MFLDYPSKGKWDQFENKIKNKLGEGQYKVKAYIGLNHALNEVLRGLVKLFVHKDSICLFKDQGPWFFQYAELFSAD